MTGARRILVSADQHARNKSLPLALIEGRMPEIATSGPEVDCRNTARSLGLVSTQHGNPEVNLRDAIAKISKGHLVNRIAEPNRMASINRTQIQLLSSDAYARGAKHPSGWHRPVGPAGAATSDGMLTEALMPRCLEPVVGRHGEVAKRSGVADTATGFVPFSVNLTMPDHLIHPAVGN